MVTNNEPSNGWSAIDLEQPTSIACFTATNINCAIVDNVGNVLTTTDLGTGPWSTNSIDGTNYMTAVSCSTSGSTFCLTVDNSGNAVVTSTAPNVWNSPTSVTNKTLVATSCWQTTPENRCVAIDKTGRAIYYNGVTWSPSSISVGPGVLTSLSCTASGGTLCVAGDNLGNVYTTIDPSASGGLWSGATYIEKVGNVYAIDSISCPTSTFCAAVDSGGNVIIFNGVIWSATPINIDSTNILTSISCTSTSFCAAVDNAGNVLTSTTPTAWPTGTQVNIDSTNTLDSISCPTSSYCETVDDLGDVLWSTDPTGGIPGWSNPWGLNKSSITTNSLSSISCATENQTFSCVATDSKGYGYTGSNGSFSQTLLDPAANVSPMPSVSCAAYNYCTIADGAGNALFYNGSSFTGTTSITITNPLALIPEAQ